MAHSTTLSPTGLPVAVPSGSDRAAPLARPSLRASERTVSKAAPVGTAPPARLWWVGLFAALAWTVLGAITWFWPNLPVGFSDWAYTQEFAVAAWGVAAVLWLTVAWPRWLGRRAARLRG